jgi:hypothetical protein
VVRTGTDITAIATEAGVFATNTTGGRRPSPRHRHPTPPGRHASRR